MSDLRIDRIPEKFRKDAVNFDDNGDKLLNDEELSCFCENMKIQGFMPLNCKNTGNRQSCPAHPRERIF